MCSFSVEHFAKSRQRLRLHTILIHVVVPVLQHFWLHFEYNYSHFSQLPRTFNHNTSTSLSVLPVILENVCVNTVKFLWQKESSF